MGTNAHAQELRETLGRIGIQKGDTVYVHARLFRFGGLASDQEEFIRIFLDPLLDAVGYPEGTIVVITYTTRYSTYGEPFVYEETPSEAGILTEHIRRMPGAVRSFHPIGSVTAIGSKSHDICDGVSRSLFGWGSVYHRLHILKAKCLYLGITLGETCSFLHYVEHLYGVSHCYHKAFFHPVYRDGKLVEGPFLAFLRNRKSKPYDFSRFEKHMDSLGLVRASTFAGAPVQLVDFTDCFDQGMKVLDTDPCFFLKEPFYVTE
ncbi:MAG: AAC(3) family N-acetyltransferase [Patescibacteria group bacterium]